MQNNRCESNIDWLDPDLPSRRCSIEYFTFLSFICGSVVTKLGSSGRSSITGQLNHFSPTYSDLMFSLNNDYLRSFKLIYNNKGSTFGPRISENIWSRSGLSSGCGFLFSYFCWLTSIPFDWIPMFFDLLQNEWRLFDQWKQNPSLEGFHSKLFRCKDQTFYRFLNCIRDLLTKSKSGSFLWSTN